jgi:uncharacterized membrane protein
MNDVAIAEKPGLTNLTHVMYALHAFSAVSGLLSPAFIVTAFLTGWPSLIAVLINYIKRGEARGTWLESHFRWQMRTFWFAVLWVGLALLFGLTLIGIPVALVIAFVAGVWVLYRLIRGWLRLNDRQPMPI